MPWRVVKRLRPHPRSATQARNFCVSRLTSVLAGEPGVEKLISDAATAAGELVTKAVTAGSSTIELFLGLDGPCVRIAVSDGHKQARAEFLLPSADGNRAR